MQAQTLRDALEATQSALKDVEAARKHLKTPVARKRELSQPGQTLLSKAKEAVKKPKMDVDELHQQLLEHGERPTESYDVSDDMKQYLDSAVDVPPHHRLIAQAATDAYTARQYLEDLEDEGVFDMPTAKPSNLRAMNYTRVTVPTESGFYMMPNTSPTNATLEGYTNTQGFLKSLSYEEFLQYIQATDDDVSIEREFFITSNLPTAEDLAGDSRLIQEEFDAGIGDYGDNMRDQLASYWEVETTMPWVVYGTVITPEVGAYAMQRLNTVPLMEITLAWS